MQEVITSHIFDSKIEKAKCHNVNVDKVIEFKKDGGWMPHSITHSYFYA